MAKPKLPLNDHFRVGNDMILFQVEPIVEVLDHLDFEDAPTVGAIVASLLLRDRTRIKYSIDWGVNSVENDGDGDVLHVWATSSCIDEVCTTLCLLRIPYEVDEHRVYEWKEPSQTSGRC